MGEAAKKLIEAALKLPRTQRIQLAERLLATIDGEPEKGVAGAWEAEIRRRTRQIEQGKVRPIPWSEVKRAAARSARMRQ